MDWSIFMGKSKRFSGQDNIFSKRLKKLIVEKGITQKELADEIGVKQQTIAQYGNGETQPSLERIYDIADIFNVSIDYLLGKTEAKSTDIELRAVCDYTGLSEESIICLRDFFYPDELFKRTESDDPDSWKRILDLHGDPKKYSLYINKLITSGEFVELLNGLFVFEEDINTEVNLLKEDLKRCTTYGVDSLWGQEDKKELKYKNNIKDKTKFSLFLIQESIKSFTYKLFKPSLDEKSNLLSNWENRTSKISQEYHSEYFLPRRKLDKQFGEKKISLEEHRIEHEKLEKILERMRNISETDTKAGEPHGNDNKTE